MGVLLVLEFTKGVHREVVRTQDEDGVLIHLLTAEQPLAKEAS